MEPIMEQRKPLLTINVKKKAIKDKLKDGLLSQDG